MSPLHKPRPVTTRQDLENDDNLENNPHLDRHPQHDVQKNHHNETTTVDTTPSSSTSSNSSNYNVNSGSSPSSSDNTSSWVGRKVDALFSPVLSFLGASNENDDDPDHPNNKEEAHDSAKATIAPPTTPTNCTATVSTSHSNGGSTGGIIEEDHEEDAVAPAITDEDVPMDQKEEAVTPTTTLTAPATTALGGTSTSHKDNGCIDGNASANDMEEEEDDPYGSIEEDPSSSFEEEEFNPYLFIKCLPSYPLVKHMRPPIALPPKSNHAPPLSLILDLDETLVHCTVDPVSNADLVFPVVFHGAEYQVHVRLRPHLFDFLEAVYEEFEVVVFTASQQVYADELLNRIDPDKKYIKHRMFRESCLAVEGNYLKDLHVCGRDLTKTVLVDNSPHAFGYQVDNGIPIESWFDDPNDTELLKLAAFVKTLHGEKDVRHVVRERFQTYKLVRDS